MSTLDPPPDETAMDVVADLTTAAASMIPVVGGGIDHVIQAWFGPPIEKRRQVWFIKLWEAVVGIAERQDRSAEEVISSPMFQSAVLEASRIALGQHIEAKLDMLKAILEHHALDEERPDVVTRRYLRWVEEMDVEHVLVLRYAADPRGWYAERGLPLSSDPTASRLWVFNAAKIPLDAEILELVLDDLSSRGLMDKPFNVQSLSADERDAPLATAKGREWLRWITLV